MSKTIKFNLICDDKPIRTIEDLQENFSIEDVLKYYHNGLLLRWLTVRGYTEEQNEVSAIKDTEPLAIIQKLIKIFGIGLSESDIKEGLYAMEYHDSQIQRINDFHKNEAQFKENSTKYIKHYDEIIHSIQTHSDNMPYIKTCLQEIIDNYLSFFRFSYFVTLRNLFITAPMAIIIMLTKKEFRQYILSDEIFPDATEADTHSVKMLNEWVIAESNKEESFYDPLYLDKILGNNIKYANGATDGYWKDVEPKEKKIMVLRAPTDIRIRNAGKTGEELLNKDYMKKFLILDGLDYKCNVDDHYIRYIEV